MTVSALGLALVVSGVVLVASVSRGQPTTDGAGVGVRVQSAVPFVVEPAVRLEAVSATPEPPPRGHPHRGVPLRLLVPALDVDAPVVRIRAPEGELRPPDDPTVLGWWRGGARPGAAVGSALITGHTVSSGGGAFDDLETLRAGERVRVRTTRGVVGYRVTGVTIYRKASLARDAERVFSQSVPGRLVLVTCEDWNGSVYLSNAVVFADPIG